MEDQIKEWIPNCFVDEVDVDSLTSEEIRKVLLFVRGDDEDGALPLESSSQ